MEEKKVPNKRHNKYISDPMSRLLEINLFSPSMTGSSPFIINPILCYSILGLRYSYLNTSLGVNLNEKVKEEVKEKVKEEVKEKVKEEVKEKVKEKVKEEEKDHLVIIDDYLLRDEEWNLVDGKFSV